jgi:hypothetical protein
MSGLASLLRGIEPRLLARPDVAPKPVGNYPSRLCGVEFGSATVLGISDSII